MSYLGHHLCIDTNMQTKAIHHKLKVICIYDDTT